MQCQHSWSLFIKDAAVDDLDRCDQGSAAELNVPVFSLINIDIALNLLDHFV